MFHRLPSPGFPVGDLPFQSIGCFWIAGALLASAAAAAWFRRIDLSRSAAVAFAIGAVLLACAAGGPVLDQAGVPTIAVMVDLSPSTRTADYRDPRLLQRRIDELLGEMPHRVTYFSDRATNEAPIGSRLPDLPCERTVYTPPDADAALLFSDCRFEVPPTGPPTYVAIDPALDDVRDAAVRDLEIRGEDLAVTVSDSGGPRDLTVTGDRPTTIDGSMTSIRPMPKGATAIRAELSPGDAWPENDSLSINRPPPTESERWWIGAAPPTGWRGFDPSELPVETAAWLTPSVVVLNNLSAADFDSARAARIEQYVRDLGGGLLLLGGDRAFAPAEAGMFPESISPLSSHAPAPTTHWILLADASGSMSAPADGATRWSRMNDAIAAVLRRLPPRDLVSVGSFAADLDWSVRGLPVNELRARGLGPPKVSPHGPTNLEPALRAIAAGADGAMPVQLLVFSDFDTRIADPAGLRELLRSKRIRLHLLAIEPGSAYSILQGIAIATGGSAAIEPDPNRWSRTADELLSAAEPSRVMREPATIRFVSQAAPAPSQAVSLWNRVWLREGATLLAENDRTSPPSSAAARWNFGSGQVLAAAFAPQSAQLQTLLRLVERPPRDPRFRVTWHTGANLRIEVRATDGPRYLNDRAITLELLDPAVDSPIPQTIAVPQTGPGLYSLRISSPRSSRAAAVRVDGHAIERRVLAGRYAPEFDALGNDRAAMERIAEITGGAVIPPSRKTPLKIAGPRRPIELRPWGAAAGALFLAVGLILTHRRGGRMR